MSMDRRSSLRRGSPHKDRAPAIVIPNIPKVIDEKSRMKLMCDYDKYEAELFKHHIGTPESTQTISLKSVPTDFDRRVPQRNDLTLVERDYEARRRLQAPAKSGAHSLLPHALSLERAAAVGAVSATSTTLAAASSSSKRRPKRQTGDGAAPSPVVHAAANAETAPAASPGAGAGGAEGTAVGKEKKATMVTAAGAEAAPIPEHVLPPVSARQRSLLKQAAPSAALPSPQRPLTSKSPTSRRPQLRPQRKDGGALSFHVAETATAAGTAAATAAAAGGKPGKASSSLHPASPRGEETLDAERCGKLLRVLLDTPVEFSESFKMDLSHIDLNWMRGKRFPTTLVTLANFRDAHGASLNSPRSTVVLLRNGLVAADILPHKTGDDADAVTLHLPSDPDLRQAALRTRQEALARRREALLTSLLNEYTALNRTAPLVEVVRAFQAEQLRREADVALPSTILAGHERQQQVLESMRRRLERQVAFRQDVQQRERTAEARRAQAEEELSARLSARRAAEEEARRLAEARLVAQRQRAAGLEAFHAQRLLERQERAEARLTAQRAAAERLAAQRAAEEAQREADRLRAVERLQLVRAADGERLAARLAAHEQRLRLAREAAELRATTLTLEAAKRAAEAQQRREAAKRRAASVEAERREAAEAQQRLVDERLAQFETLREAERERRAAEEEMKRERRVEAAVTKEERRKLRQSEAAAERAQREREREVMETRKANASVVRQEREREEAEAKAFAVVRKKRSVEFGKLEMVLRLLAKREAADFVDRQREALLQETLKSREELLLERNALRDKIANETAAYA